MSSPRPEPRWKPIATLRPSACWPIANASASSPLEVPKLVRTSMPPFHIGSIAPAAVSRIVVMRIAPSPPTP
jgi:hypothetical protein